MTAAPQSQPEARPPIVRMFEKEDVPLHRLPAFQTLADEFALHSAAGLKAMTASEWVLSVTRIDRRAPAAAIPAAANSVAVSMFVADWNASAAVSIDSTLVHSVLSAMCGGEWQGEQQAERQMTGLERDVARHVASLLLAQFGRILGIGTALRLEVGQVLSPAAPSILDKARGDYVVLTLTHAPSTRVIVVAVPVHAVELIREQLTTPPEVEDADLDPGWSRQFQKGVGTASVELVGWTHGPPMTLGDVARLTVGSIVEIDPASLQRIRLECAGEPVFEGRLGQSKGLFTVCLETPSKPRK